MKQAEEDHVVQVKHSAAQGSQEDIKAFCCHQESKEPNFRIARSLNQTMSLSNSLQQSTNTETETEDPATSTAHNF